MDHREAAGEARREAFVRLYQKNERKLYGYILSLVPDITAADDICQDTSLRAWQQFEQFDPSKDFLAWACTIAYYRVLNYRTLRSRAPAQLDSAAFEFVAERLSARRDELAEKQKHLMECLAQLNEFKQQTMQLYYSLGMTAKAVADRLGRSAAAIEKVITRTRYALYECVETAMRRENHV